MNVPMQLSLSAQLRAYGRYSGASLLLALVMMLVMSLSLLAWVRLAAADLLLAGNAAFRQSAVLAAEAGQEAALAWLRPLAQDPSLLADRSALGYYASVPVGLVMTGNSAGQVGIDWDSDGCAGRTLRLCLAAAPEISSGMGNHRIRYTIHRLCRTAGSTQAASNSCLNYQASAQGGGSKGQMSYGAAMRITPTEQVYYRITTRVRGPRNTTVFTQTLVHF